MGHYISGWALEIHSILFLGGGVTLFYNCSFAYAM